VIPTDLDFDRFMVGLSNHEGTRTVGGATLHGSTSSP
jgi:hypothetical protein